MKRLILTLALTLGIAASALAQNYAVVNSEKVFKSVEKYNAAITQLDELAKQYQAQVDAKFEEVRNSTMHICSAKRRSRRLHSRPTRRIL